MKHLPLAALLRDRPSSLAVLLYLLETTASTNKRTLYLSRAKIAQGLQIHEDTVTRALGCLRAADMIDYRVHTRTNSKGEMRGRYLQVSLRKKVWKPFYLLALSLDKTAQKPVRAQVSSFGKTAQKPVPSFRENGRGLCASAPPALLEIHDDERHLSNAEAKELFMENKATEVITNA